MKFEDYIKEPHQAHKKAPHSISNTSHKHREDY